MLVSFDLTPPEQARLSKLVAPPRYRARLAFALAAGQLVMGVTYLGLNHFLPRPHAAQHGPWDVLGIFYCALGVYWAFFAYRSIRPRGLPARASLEVTEAGLSGTLDGIAATIAWSDISGLCEYPDAYAVLLRNVRLWPIAIPKAALADPAEFRAICEDHLIAKRGLVRPSHSPIFIVNTAC